MDFAFQHKKSVNLLGGLDNLMTTICKDSRVCWNFPFLPYHSLQVLSSISFVLSYFRIYCIVKFCYFRVPWVFFINSSRCLESLAAILEKLAKAAYIYPCGMCLTAGLVMTFLNVFSAW